MRVPSMRVPFVCMLIASIAGATAAMAAKASKRPSTPPSGGRLEPNVIQSTFFNGEAFTSATPQNIRYKMVFNADGKMTREPLGKTGIKGEGTWKLSKDGFCTTWKGSPSNCFRILAAGDKKWSILKGTGIVGTWSK